MEVASAERFDSRLVKRLALLRFVTAIDVGNEVALQDSLCLEYWLKITRCSLAKSYVTTYAAPVLKSPPPFHSYFCSNCGSPLPRPDPEGWFEIPAGLFDDDPEARP